MNLRRSLRIGGGQVARHTIAVMHDLDLQTLAYRFPALAAFRPDRWLSLDPDTGRAVVESAGKAAAL